MRVSRICVENDGIFRDSNADKGLIIHGIPEIAIWQLISI